MDPESPQAIESQVDSDESQNNHDSHNSDDDQTTTSISQAQFATQIPPSYQAVQALERGNKNEKVRKSSVPDELRLPVSEELTAIPQQVSPSRLNSKKKSRTEDEIESSFADMTVRPLFVPSSGMSVEADAVRRQKLGAGRILTQVEENLSEMSKHLSVMDTMPPVLRDLLKGLKEEYHNDGRLPHRLQVIPKDQAKLLDSDYCWQPPLVGYSHRPGAVPQALLERLIREADQEIPSEPIVADAVHHVSGEEEEPAESKRSHTLDQGDGCRSVDIDSNDSESDSEAASWEESPLRPPHKGLERPPDTPPPKPIELIRLESEREMLNNRRDQSVERPSTVFQPVLDKPVSSVSNLVDARAETVLDGLVPSTDKRVNREEIRHPSSPATSSSNLPFVPVDRLKAIQVKRTPISLKNDLAANELPNSSTNLIPGTFDEHSHEFTKPISHNTPSSAAKMGERSRGVRESYNDFENNSSEDEAVQRNLPISSGGPVMTHSGTKDKRLEDLAPSTKEDSRKSDTSSSNIIDNSYGKRKRETASRPNKRVRYSGVEQSSGHQKDPDYDQIDKDKVLYRRECLSEIGQARTPDKSNRATGSCKMYGPQTAHSQTSYQHSHTLASSPELRQHVYPDTSDTHELIHQHVQENARTQPPRTSDSLLRAGHRPTTMYARFKTAYPNYGGQEGNFDASCRLLKRLQLQEKATHPSLWDDFVFHHYHSYRQYLQEVIEQCGNALPYEKFYESVEPSCYRRVIKSAYLETIEIDPRSSNQIRIQSIDRTSDRMNVVGPGQSVRPVESVDRPVLDMLVSRDERTGNIEPRQSLAQTPRLPPEAPKQIESNQKSKNFDQILQNQDSQDSHTSVSIWLHESGAESPILDTPTANPTKENEIEVIDITQECQSSPPALANPTPTTLPSSTQQKKKKRPLPWDLDNQTKSSPAESSKSRTKPQTTVLEITKTRPTTSKTTTIPPSSSGNRSKPSSNPVPKNINSTVGTNKSKDPTPTINPRSIPVPPAPGGLTSSQQQPQQKPLPPPPPPLLPHQPPSSSFSSISSTHESPFLRCLRQYRQLSSEKPTQLSTATTARKIEVDISSWRRK